MNWRAQTTGGRSLIIRCDSQIDARVLALRLFMIGRAELSVTQESDLTESQLELRWARSPGPPRSMRPEVRERRGETWGPWKDERDFVLGTAP